MKPGDRIDFIVQNDSRVVPRARNRRLEDIVDMVFQHADVIASAIGAARESGVELADCVIAELNRREGCETTLTVDRKASRLAAMRLLADR